MKNLDMEISQEVAKKASEKINNVKRELEDNKDSYNSFLKDVLHDSRENTRFLKKVIVSLLIVILVLILGMVGLNIYNQNTIKKMSKENMNEFMKFINETDFYYEVDLSNESSNFNYNTINSK